MTYAEAVAATIHDDVEGSEDPGNAAADYVGSALGIAYLVDGHATDPYQAVREVRLTVTVGGPYATVTYRTGSTTLTVDAVEGSETSTAWTNAPNVAAELGFLAEIFADEVLR